MPAEHCASFSNARSHERVRLRPNEEGRTIASVLRPQEGRTHSPAPLRRVSGVAKMYLMMYLDDAGKVVYTLKARGTAHSARVRQFFPVYCTLR